MSGTCFEGILAMKVACRFMGVRIRFRVTVGVFSEHLRGAFARGARENHRWGVGLIFLSRFRGVNVPGESLSYWVRNCRL